MLLHSIHQLSIKKRNLLGFFSVILLLLIISIVSVASVVMLANNNHLLYEKPYMINQNVWTITSGFNTLEKEMYKVVATDSSDSILQTTADVLSSIQRLRGLLNQASPHQHSLDSLEMHLTALNPIRQQIIDALLNEQKEEALTLLKEDYVPHLSEASLLTESLSAMATQTAQNFVSDSKFLSLSALIVIVLLTLLSIVAAFFISIYITKTIITPLQAFESKLRRFAKGELSVRFDADTSDEIGHLGECLNHCTDKLNQYIHHISSALYALATGHLDLETTIDYSGDFAPIQESLSHIAHSLKSTLAQVQSSTDKVSDGSLSALDDAKKLETHLTTQTLITTNLSEQLELLFHNVSKNAETAHSLDTNAVQSVHSLEKGKATINQVVLAMEAINASVHQISSIITSIEEIAKQSHLLSLNASIEAARLGDAGRGFNVIALEMQALSLASSGAAKKTTNLIHACFHATSRGTSCTSSAVEAIDTILSEVSITQKLIASISKTSTKQTSSLSSMVSGVKELKAESYTLSTFATHSTLLSETLASEAQELSAQVSLFIK